MRFTQTRKRTGNKANVAFKKMRPGSYKIHKDDEHKHHVNGMLSIFMSNIKDNIFILDNVKMLTSKALIKMGILSRRITVVEYNEQVFEKMNRSLGVNIIYGGIEDYIIDMPIQKIGGIYFDYTGNHVPLKAFKRCIRDMRKHEIPDVLKIATTFSTGRKGKLNEPDLHNQCLDILEEVFDDYEVEPKYYYMYKRAASGYTMHHQHYVLRKKMIYSESF
jgi:hypothetical protein